MRLTVCLLWASAAFLSACGSDNPPAAMNPTISITMSPAMTPAGVDFSISVATTNFDLRTPMPSVACPTAGRKCGHIHILIDNSTTCTAAGAPYNSTIYSGTVGTVHLAADPNNPANNPFCPTLTGQHTLIVEFHDDSHNEIHDSNGNLISARATVNIQ